MPIQLKDVNGNLVAMTNAQKTQFLNDIGAMPAAAQVLPLDARLVTEGDSLTDYENTGGQNWQFYFQLFTGARLYRPQGSNQALGGQKISGLLGDATYISDETQIAAVRAQKPAVVTLIAGTNDIAGGVTDVAGIINAFKTAISGYLASDGTFGGASYVVVGKIPPRNPITDTTWTAAKERIRLHVNAQIALLPTWNNKVIIAETDSDNAAGSWDLTSANTTYQADGIHQSWLGFRIIARAVANAMSGILPQARPTHSYLDATNLCTNPMLYGTAGSMTGNAGAGVPVPVGQVADSWSVANNMNGVSVSCTKDTLDGAVAQRIVFSGTLNTAGGQCFFTQTVAYSGAAGEGYECMFDVEIASGMSNIRNIFALCDTATSPVSASTTPFVGDQPLRGTIRTKVTAPLTGVDTSSLVRLGITAQTAGQSVALDIKISKPYFRKITQQTPL